MIRFERLYILLLEEKGGGNECRQLKRESVISRRDELAFRTTDGKCDNLWLILFECGIIDFESPLLW